MYGQPTDTFQLSKCNFNVKSLKGIGQVKYPDPIGIVYINMVCFESDKSDSNKLDFTVEIVKYPEKYIKKNSIISLN